MSLKSISCNCYPFSSSEHLWKGKMPKSLLVWFTPFRPPVAGNTGKLPCPDKPRDIPRLCISKLIHFPKLLYNLCNNVTSRRKGDGWEDFMWVLIFRMAWHVWAGVTVGDLRKVLEGGHRSLLVQNLPHDLVSWRILSACFVELVCLSLTAVVLEIVPEESGRLCLVHTCTGGFVATARGLQLRRVETGWLVNSNSWQRI